MIVVIDTSVVLHLCFLHEEGLLTKFYEQIVAPSAVQREFERLATFDKRFKGLAFPAFIEIVDPTAIPDQLKSAITLDEGEIAALAVAVERKIRDVLIDERPARQMAKQLGLRVSGLLGIWKEKRGQSFFLAFGQENARRPCSRSFETRSRPRFLAATLRTLP